MRASAASVWVLAAHIMLLPLAVLQAAIVIYTRIFGEEYQLSTFEEHAPLLESPGLVKEAYDVEMPVEMPVTLETPTTNGSAVIAPAFSAFGARGLVDISTATAGEADCAGGRAAGPKMITPVFAARPRRVRRVSVPPLPRGSLGGTWRSGGTRSRPIAFLAQRCEDNRVHSKLTNARCS